MKITPESVWSQQRIQLCWL